MPGAEDAAGLEEMQRRTSALAAQLHPRLQTLLDFVLWEGDAYTISKPMPGRSLADHLWQGPLPWPEARRILRGVLELLEIAHARALPHLHLDPSAVVLSPDGSICLRFFSQGPSDLPVPGDSHRAPELDRGEGGPSSDLYACGALIPDLLGADTALWPEEAARFHALLCHPDPRGRPASVRGARALLDVPAERSQPPSRWWRMAAILTIAGGLAGWGAWHMRPSRVLPEQLEGEARSNYLLAREHFSRRTPADIQKAENTYLSVIRRVPTCSEAWSGLSSNQALLGVYGLLPRAEALAKARQSAQRALELDPRNAEAIAVQAYLDFRYEWHWDAGEKGFRKALAMDPERPLIRHWWGFYLSLAGRSSQAIDELEWAHRLDPVDRQITTNLAVAKIWAGDSRGGTRLIEDLLYHDPHFDSARNRLRMALEAEGKIPEALTETREMVRHGLESEAAYQAQSEGWRKGGAKGYFQTRIAQLRRHPNADEVHSFYLAQVCALMGDRDAAFAALNQAVAQRDLFLIWAPQDPAFRSLREDSRWAALLEALHYPGKQ
jgi:serine/threonine protein kinase